MTDVMKNRLMLAIEPKSDRINFDDVQFGPMVLTVKTIKMTDDNKIVIVNEETDKHYYPCKTMSRVLLNAWGKNGKDWLGKKYEVVGDPSVRFGKDAVGGVRLSRLSGIDGAVTTKITLTRGKRADYTVQPLGVAE